LQKSLKKKINKIGILGGTFDPPHIGHLHISKIAIKKLKLSKMIWVITKRNPLKKKPHLKIRHRLNLSKKITKKEKKIQVKYFDDKIKSTKTYDLLNYLKKRNVDSKLFFIIGADNLAQIHKWHNWQKIPMFAKIVVLPRQNYSLKSLKSAVYKKLIKKDLIYIKSKKINISSSLIRKFW